MGKKNIKYWESALKESPNSYKKWFREEKLYLKKHITKNSKVLEIGCGEGRTINDILPITEKIIAIDHDKKAVEKAKKNLKNYSKIQILLAKAESLPFKNDSFDFITCMAVLSNLKNKKIKALKEMKRVIKENGFIIMSMYSEDAFEERMKLYKKMKTPIKRIEGTTVIFNESLGDNVSEQHSKKELIELFKKVGLKVIDIKKVGIAYLCKLSKIRN